MLALMNARWIVGGTVCVVLAATSWMVACVGDAGSTGTGTDAGGVDGGGTADTGPGNTADGSTFDAGTVDSGCGDTKSSADNCGTCGHKCSAGNACFTGRCGNEVVLLGGSASSGDSCALLANGTVWGWGDNLNGDLGVGDKLARNFATKITVDSTGATFDHVVDVGIGFGHACARKDDGSIWCWGQGKDGATGVTVDPLQADVLVPTKVGNLSGYKSLRVSGDTNCGIDANDDVYCWARTITCSSATRRTRMVTSPTPATAARAWCRRIRSTQTRPRQRWSGSPTSRRWRWAISTRARWMAPVP